MSSKIVKSGGGTLVDPVADLGDVRLETALGELWSRLESPESRRGYRDDWRRYCVWLRTLGIDPRQATTATVQHYISFLRDTKKATATRARALSVLREVYRSLVVGGVCLSNPAREVRNTKVDNEPRTPWLVEEEAKELFVDRGGESWRERRDFAACLCLFLLGWRRAEVARISIGDFVGGAIRHTVKRKKLRVVGVPTLLLKEISNWRAFAQIDQGPLFPRSPKTAAPMTGKMLYGAVKRRAKAAGLERVSPHVLRRTFITLLVGRGVPLEDLQLAVSHESVTTTERYFKATRAATQAPGDLLVDLVNAN